MRLDGDSAFLLQVHCIEDLIAEHAFLDGFGVQEEAIGQRGFSVVNVRDNAEVSDFI
jgi:hypothetical protein